MPGLFSVLQGHLQDIALHRGGLVDMVRKVTDKLIRSLFINFPTVEVTVLEKRKFLFSFILSTQSWNVSEVSGLYNPPSVPETNLYPFP